MSLVKTIISNTLSNWVGMGLSTILSIVLTPFLLSHLGAERYGIYQIVFPITQYLILLELGLRGSIARFASKHIYAQDIKSLYKLVS